MVGYIFLFRSGCVNFIAKMNRDYGLATRTRRLKAPVLIRNRQKPRPTKVGAN